MSEKWLDVFVTAAGASVPTDEALSLKATLSAQVARARAAWPDVALDPETFVSHLGGRIGADLAALAGLSVEDLYLACAAGHGDPRAIAALEQRELLRVADYVARIDASSTFATDVQQALRERLLFGDGRPRVLEYGGRGPLGGWIRVAAVRTALNLKRGAKREIPLPPSDFAAGADPEVDYLKERYRADFKAAFAAALSALDTDGRNVLRLHYLDGLNLDEVGAVYRVHRATVARWIARARTQILEETRRRLQERLGIAASEADSVMGLVQSRLDLTFRGLLGRD
jgi:RNA polymerase sigma-70 factor (ECF subfamily)